MLLVNALLVCLAIGLGVANEAMKADSEKGIPGNYKLVNVTVNGEVKKVDSYILRIRQWEDVSWYAASMSFRGVNGYHKNLDGSIDKTGNDTEGDLYRFTGVYSSDNFQELTIIAPEANTILQFKREIPEEKPKE